ncbi:MAG: hypothetical protein K2K94_01290 [Muribaculaceae bacterium]|nr:hypothetical protein [Muribaculaceae bacterium]
MLSAAIGFGAMASESADDAIKRLDRALDMRQHYIELRQHSIDSLKGGYTLNHEPARLIDIGDAYSLFVNDSALHYYELAMETATARGDSVAASLKYASLLPLAGLHEAAHKIYEATDTSRLDDVLKKLYHESGRQLYSYLASAYSDYEPYRKACTEKSLVHQARLLEMLDKRGDDYLFNLGEYYFINGDSVRAEALLGQLVEQSDDRRLLARANHHLSAMALGRGDEEAYRSYLAASAIADIESATLEVMSLQELGDALYEEGDIEHSYRYLSTALDNAVKCGAQLRMVESSRSLPLIARAHNDQIATWRTWIYIIMGVMALLLIALGISLATLYKEMKHLDKVQQRLRQANCSKDAYISRFLQLCSIYMDKLNAFCKIAERKISAGKADELYRMTKSGKFIEEQSADFYNVFDDAFLHLYPDFAEQVNALLKPECQITLNDGERLNTDLRILAIKRMGIDDAASIAQILNYSLNTIYAYRNRLKARAIDRDNFEENVMKIAPQT